MEKYTISWSQPMSGWQPLNFGDKAQEKPEPEITDFTQAREVLAKIMSK
jgi:hypothetical protein